MSGIFNYQEANERLVAIARAVKTLCEEPSGTEADAKQLSELAGAIEPLFLSAKLVCETLGDSHPEAGDAHRFRGTASSAMLHFNEGIDSALLSANSILDISVEPKKAKSVEGILATVASDYPDLTFNLVNRSEAKGEQAYILGADLKAQPYVYRDIINLLDNLLRNAARFTPKGGEVVVESLGNGLFAVKNTKEPGAALTNDILYKREAGMVAVDAKAESSGIGLPATLRDFGQTVAVTVDEAASRATDFTVIHVQVPTVKAFDAVRPYVAFVDDERVGRRMVGNFAKKGSLRCGNLAMQVFESHVALRAHVVTSGLKPSAVLSDQNLASEKGLTELNAWRREGVEKVLLLSSSDVDGLGDVRFYNRGTGINQGQLNVHMADLGLNHKFPILVRADAAVDEVSTGCGAGVASAVKDREVQAIKPDAVRAACSVSPSSATMESESRRETPVADDLRRLEVLHAILPGLPEDGAGDDLVEVALDTPRWRAEALAFASNLAPAAASVPARVQEDLEANTETSSSSTLLVASAISASSPRVAAPQASLCDRVMGLFGLGS